MVKRKGINSYAREKVVKLAVTGTEQEFVSGVKNGVFRMDSNRIEKLRF